MVTYYVSIIDIKNHLSIPSQVCGRPDNNCFIQSYIAVGIQLGFEELIHV
jgi:hypothetical protein